MENKNRETKQLNCNYATAEGVQRLQIAVAFIFKCWKVV